MFMNVSFFYPRHWLSQKLVTTHGDLHYGNIVCGKNSLKVIDFEYSGVTFLIHDIAFIFQWLDFDCKMPFLRHYLESAGKGMDNVVLTEDDIQEIYLDAEIYWLGLHTSPLSPLSYKCHSDTLEFSFYEEKVEIVRGDKSIQSSILTGLPFAQFCHPDRTLFPFKF